MKHSVILAAMATAVMLPATGWAQSTQLLPDNITEIRLEDYAALKVKQGDENRLSVEGNARQMGTYKGSRLTLNETNEDAVLYLKPGRAMSFNTQDFSALTFQGNFAPFDSLAIHSEDYSRISYEGESGDTLRTERLSLKCEDYSRITSSRPVQFGIGRHTALDYSRITLDAVDLSSRLAPSGVTEDLYTNSDFGRINTGRYTIDGVEKHPRVAFDSDEKLEMLDKVSNGVGDMVRKAKKKAVRHPWHTEFDLAFGWHNWGDQLGAGFSGVQGPAEVNTNFHNIQLAINIPVVNVQGFALKAGLGLDWDRYNFTTPEVFFDATATPMSFAAGTVTTATTRLKARSVVVPVKFEFGNPKKWHFSITALPGLNWSGDNTGIRRKTEVAGADQSVKDYSVNSHFNPYRMDVRAAVQYKGIGLYVQTAMLSLLRDDCQPLYPVKFGIII